MSSALPSLPVEECLFAWSIRCQDVRVEDLREHLDIPRTLKHLHAYFMDRTNPEPTAVQLNELARFVVQLRRGESESFRAVLEIEIRQGNQVAKNTFMHLMGVFLQRYANVKEYRHV